MADAKRSVVRILVPLLLLVGGGIGLWLVVSSNATRSGGTGAGVQSGGPQATAEAAKADSTKAEPAKAEPGKAEPGKAEPAKAEPGKAEPGEGVSAKAATGDAPGRSASTNSEYKARTFAKSVLTPLGSAEPKDKGGQHQLELRFSELGAGLEAVTLANHFTTIQKTSNDVIQAKAKLPGADRLGLAAFAADAVEIDGQRVSVWMTEPGKAATDVSFWRQTGAGVFEAIIEDGDGKDVLRITRRYVLAPGSYEFTIEQQIENVTDRALSVRYAQFGPMDLPLGTVRYGGDVRRLRFGYTRPLRLDPDQVVSSGDSKAALKSHADVLGSPTGTTPAGLPRWDVKTLWPNAESKDRELTAAWAAMTSRYFTVAVHARPPAGAPAAPGGIGGGRELTKVAETIDRMAIATPPDTHARGPQGVAALRMTSPATSLGAGSRADFSVTVYAGPTSQTYIGGEPGAFWAGVQRVVIFTFGGPCGFCTFQPVAEFLRWFLGFLHDRVFFDWSLAIMFLVVCVRGVLHPVTRWSQTNMLRFGKHMSKLAPKQKAIQEKYGNDPVKMREEVARLMREEHVSYASGAMGCVPMFMQMPVWIALYAMLFFTFELRHEHAFYGVIQNLTNHRWGFLGDLAEPDNLIPFGSSFWVPGLSSLMGPIEGFNILPIVLGVVFFIQQKYLTPPQTTPMTPEQETQMKVMKVMTVVMFPLFMYNAPSGLALYFMVNSTLGIIESKWIRGHAEKKIEAEEQAREERKKSGGPRRDKDDAKPKGIMARLQQAVEERQKLMEQQKKLAEKYGKKSK